MPTPVPATTAQDEGAWRFSGMYGSAYRDGLILADVTEVAGTLTVNRTDVPLVGRTSNGQKRGRETREGTMTIQKIDSRWEFELWQSIRAGIAQRRAARDAGTPLSYAFSLELWYDDPDALGKEGVRLNGVQIWDMPVGFNIGDDIVSRQFTISWDSEDFLNAFQAQVSSTGIPSAQYYTGYGA